MCGAWEKPGSIVSNSCILSAIRGKRLFLKGIWKQDKNGMKMIWLNKLESVLPTEVYGCYVH